MELDSDFAQKRPFLEAIQTQPNDDAPRLIYADWLEEHGDLARAEFIRWQCQSAALERSEQFGDRILSQLHERDLIRRHGNLWATPYRQFSRRYRFARGFLENIRINEAFADNMLAQSILAYEPLSSLEFSSQTNQYRIPEIWHNSSLKQVSQHLRRIDCSGFVFHRLNPKHWPGLRELSIFVDTSSFDQFVKSLAQRPVKERLEVLSIHISRADSIPTMGLGMLRLLLQSLPELRTLKLSRCALATLALSHLPDLIAQSCPYLTHLELTENPYPDQEIFLLLSSPMGLKLKTFKAGVSASHSRIEWPNAHQSSLTTCEIQFYNTSLSAMTNVLGALKQAQTLRQMRLFQIDGNSCLLSAWANTGPSPNLQVLQLAHGSTLSDHNWSHFATSINPGLNLLSIGWEPHQNEMPTPSQTAAKPASLASLVQSTNMANLKQLNLAQVAFADDNAFEIAHSSYLTHLVSLNLPHNQIKDSGLNALLSSESLGELRELNLYPNQFSEHLQRNVRERFGPNGFYHRDPTPGFRKLSIDDSF